jgi:DNA-binding response OmpR family regulator
MAKILVVEDDREINSLLCSILKDAGHTLKSTFSGPEGMVMLRAENYDMALLDIMLPLKSNDAVLRELRSFSNMPAIVISAKDLT